MMHSRQLVIGLVVLSFAAMQARAQAPTPTPIDSNIAVQAYAQSHGSPCVSRSNTGCGGCYPVALSSSNPTSLLAEINPEWSPIGPMISGGPDPGPAPKSIPVLLQGTVALTKINVGGDFPGSHVSDDQNTFITPDPSFNGFLATGNAGTPSCPGEGCTQVEMELETGKYPLFAWAGEGDKAIALGRWIYDCGHPDPAPVGKCSNNATRDCATDADCVSPGTCPVPPALNSPNFNFRAEMHPPQAIVMIRNRSLPPKKPATQADVYISADLGGAGDRCTDTHFLSPNDVLFAKGCFVNHCSSNTGRTCKTNKDCPSKETCLNFDPMNSAPLADINAADFAFDLPLPPPPNQMTSTLKITKKSFKPLGGLMPVATFVVPTPPLGPTPSLHVVVPMARRMTSGTCSTTTTTKCKVDTDCPMTESCQGGTFPNVFAQRITAGWKDDTTALTHVQVKFKSLTISNPLKDRVPPFARQCTGVGGGLSLVACNTDKDCLASTCGSGKACHSDKDCPKTDACNSGGARCIGGVTPGWEVWGQVNGDWIQFKKLDTIGGATPFLAPPYTVPSPKPLTVAEAFTFDTYVPPVGGTVHIATTGHSVNCIDTMYGTNLHDDISLLGLTTGTGCLGAADNDPGRLDITHTDLTLATPPPGVTCVDGKPSSLKICTVTSGKGDGGTCSVTTSKLCVNDSDCPGDCSGTGGPCVADGDCKHCFNDASRFCTTGADCSAGTCTANPAQRCRKNSDCASGDTCSGAPTATCVAHPATSCHADTDCPSLDSCALCVSGSETCADQEQCMGKCSQDGTTPCHVDGDCGGTNTCVFGGAFTLTYTIQVK